MCFTINQINISITTFRTVCMFFCCVIKYPLSNLFIFSRCNRRHHHGNNSMKISRSFISFKCFDTYSVYFIKHILSTYCIFFCHFFFCHFLSLTSCIFNHLCTTIWTKFRSVVKIHFVIFKNRLFTI